MHVVLFLTYGGSLTSWRRGKVLDRELALYQELCKKGVQVTIFSYGDGRDERLVIDSQCMSVLCNKWRLPKALYVLLAPIIYRANLGQADLFKTNQMRGAHAATWCGKIFRKPVILRQGYSLYEFTRDDEGLRRLFAPLIRGYERRLLNRADAAIFTTKEMAARAVKRYHLGQGKVYVVPNFVVTSIWARHHIDQNRSPAVLGFVGRFSHQKNLESLVWASQGFPVRIEMIGSGKLEGKITSLAKHLSVQVEVFDLMTQEEIAQKMERWMCFVLPSLFEGHPKALIEAMTFGIPILAANSPGIRELIEPGKDGILVQPTVEGLRQGIGDVLQMSPKQRSELGRGARLKAVKSYSLERVLADELKIYKALVESSGKSFTCAGDGQAFTRIPPD